MPEGRNLSNEVARKNCLEGKAYDDMNKFREYFAKIHKVNTDDIMFLATCMHRLLSPGSLPIHPELDSN